MKICCKHPVLVIFGYSPLRSGGVKPHVRMLHVLKNK